MIDMLMRLVAFGLLAGSLVILVIYVPRLDLGGVVAVTLIFAFYDFFLADRLSRRG